MRYRDHRGGLSESMLTLRELENRKALVLYLRDSLRYFIDVTDYNVHITKYNENGDKRIGWDQLYIVSVDGFGVVGWTDGEGL